MSASQEKAGEMRTAVVSGGSSGIGKAIVAAFRDRGWRVAFGARRAERVAAALEDLGGAGPHLFGGTLDVAEAASIDGFYDAAEASVGPVDLVVNLSLIHI